VSVHVKRWVVAVYPTHLIVMVPAHFSVESVTARLVVTVNSANVTVSRRPMMINANLITRPRKSATG